jgi:hypothetical protein
MRHLEGKDNKEVEEVALPNKPEKAMMKVNLWGNKTKA